MASFNNDEKVSNISYINKDFQALWQELLDLVPQFTDKWDPSKANESDPLAVLLKLLAIYSDKLNYNIDKSVLENFPQTLTQLRSAYNVYDTLGYNPPWYDSANATLKLFYDGVEFVNDGNNDDKPTFPDNSPFVLDSNSNTITLKKFTQFSNEDNSQIYTSIRDVYLTNNTSETVDVPAVEGTINDFIVGGSKKITYQNLSAENKLFFTEPNVAEDGIFISFSEGFDNGSTEFQKVSNIYQNISTYPCYEFGIDPVTGACYIQFSDSIGSLIQDGIYIKYILSNGENGNVAANTINSFYQISDDNITSHFSISNPYAITSGKNPATIDEMYLNYKKVQGTFDTLVTLKDFEDFIYLYTNSDGNNIVSNIRVSDRYTDLYDSYRVMKQSVEDAGDTSIPKVEDDTMSVSNLRFYPLQNSTNVSTLSDYYTTFNILTDGTQNISFEINSAVADSKALNYDSANPAIGAPIRIPFILDGQVYLKTQVSEEDGKQVINNMKTAFYQNFNAREIEFGKEIDYQNLIDVLTKSDSRIAYVGLNPIYYVEPNLSELKIGQDDTERSVDKSKMAKRAIMMGTTPWTDYDTEFAYAFNQSDSMYDPIFGSSDSATITPKLILNNGIAFDLFNDNKRLTLQQSEDMYLYAPEMKTVATYSNWLYYEYTDNIISADVPTILNSDINFYKTRDDQTVAYTIPAGKIVKTNFNLVGDSVRKSLASTDTIEQVVRNNGALSHATQIDICTNSQELVTLLGGNTTGTVVSYTLKPTEFFLFRDTGKASITVLYEGTTIYSSIQVSSTDFKKCSISLDDITSGSYTSNIWTTVNNKDNSNVLYDELENDEAKGACWGYLINQILTFGEGITFKADSSSGAIISNKNEVTISQLANVQYTDNVDDSNSWKSLPPILPDDTWEGEVRLFLNITDTQNQKLVCVAESTDNGITHVSHNQKVEIYYDSSITADVTIAIPVVKAPISGTISAINADAKTYTITDSDSTAHNYIIDTAGTVTFLVNDNDSVTEDVTEIYSINEIYLQSNILIVSTGNPITLDKSDYGENITPRIYSYTSNDSNPTRGNFITFDSSIEVPGNSYAVIPFATGDNKIEYWVAAGGSTISDSDASFSDYNKVGIPYVTNTMAAINSTYYDGGDPEQISSLSPFPHKLEVEDDYLLDADYDPTYQVKENNLINIEELANGENYFNANHPFNRYAIPTLKVEKNGDKLKDTGWNIKISKNSLK